MNNPTRLPAHRLLEQNQHSCTVELQLDEQADCFTGHFPELPIVPGVVQLHWVHHFARQLLHIDRPSCNLERIKFKQAITPGATVLLELTRQNPQRLAYKLYSDLGIHASGRLRLQ